MSSANTAPVIKFRNYTPLNVPVDKAKEPVASPPPLSNLVPVEEVKERSNARVDVIQRELQEYANQDEINIVPKKSNWDLKQITAPRLQKLQRKTHLAIVELLRDKISNESDDN